MGLITNPYHYRRFLEITTKIGCVVNCNYCPQELLRNESKKKSVPRVMELETFKKCLDNCESSVAINFSGYVEPWTNPHCREMVLYAYKNGHMINMFTTLTGLTIEDVDAIKHIPFEIFSIHLPEAELKMNIKVDDKYLAVLDHLTNAKISNLTFHCHAKKTNPEVMTLLEEKYKIDFEDLIDRAGNLEDMGGGKTLDGPIHCARSAMLTRGVLLPNGDVQLCCMDYGLKHKVGNLTEKTYEEVFSFGNPDYANIMKSMDTGGKDLLCRTCSSAVAAPKYSQTLQKVRSYVSNDFLFNKFLGVVRRLPT